MSNLSFLGLADIYLKPYNSALPAIAVGSVSACEITHEENEIRQANFGRAGGTLNVVQRPSAVGINLTFQSLSIPNLARALRGGITDVASGSVTDEAHVAFKGALIRTARMNISDVTVTDTAEPTPATFVAGTDYRVTGSGIVILEGGAIDDEDDILISYDYTDQQIVQALTQGGDEYTLYFDGLNEADGNRNVAVDIWRIKFGLPSNLQLIGEDFISMEVSGEALVDGTQTGVGASQFYRWIYPSA